MLLSSLSPTTLGSENYGQPGVGEFSAELERLARRARSLGLAATPVDSGETIGNRFLLVWRARRPESDTWLEQSFWSDLARAVCNFGPRVDDTLHVCPTDDRRTFEFCVVGGDGRQVTHCANGLLYAGLRVHQMTGAGRRLVFQCGDVARTVEALGDGQMRVNLGRPCLLRDLEDCPAALVHSPLCRYTGEPHAVSFVDELVPAEPPIRDRFDEIGDEVCRSYAPDGINWNLVAVAAADQLTIRTFERGVRRMTRACGTGSAASFAVATATGRLRRREAIVTAAGGSHHAAWLRGQLLLTGRPTQARSARLDDFLLAAAAALPVDERSALVA